MSLWTIVHNVKLNLVLCLRISLGAAKSMNTLAGNSVIRLTGNWKIAADRRNEGREQRWFEKVRPDAQPAPVPGVIQQIFTKEYGVFWYYCAFNSEFKVGAHDRVLLRFGAVDYLADVWINSQHLGAHEGPETPFEFDITAQLKTGAENLIAVRVLNPCYERIDGILLGETPHRNKRCASDFSAGWGYNIGGFPLPVELAITPALRVTDIFAKPDAATGAIPLTLSFQNDTKRAQSAKLRITVAPAASGQAVCERTIAATVQPGASTHECSISVSNPQRWYLESPNLYRVTVEVSTDGADTPPRHEHSIRIGFRDFRVENGWFYLNGRRIFLRSTHTGNHVPITWYVEPEPGMLRRDLLLAKSGGYNMVRFIVGMPYPEQLDLCDELGLMVYEESQASWCLEDSPQMKTRFDLCLREMILRDRNHPSLTIWGVLNETRDGPVFRHAVESLKLIRELDQDRLVLLSSGRWDGEPSIGSVSNPGSSRWEHVWGHEAPGAAKRAMAPDFEPAGGYVFDAGDAHTYPKAPITPKISAFIRTLGKDVKPVFLSEFGIGSMFNAVEELRPYDRYPGGDSSFDRGFVQSMADKFTADFERWGFNSVFPFPEDLLRESYRLSSGHRRITFDLVRSNPQLCGYNVTGMLDHALTGEGLWTFWRAWKPEMADALQDGFAPLRWCLFADPLNGYSGKPIALEAVLANENVLKPGEYPVVFRIFSAQLGTVWEKRTNAVIPENAPLATPVLSEKLDLKLAPGDYVFAACLEKSGNAPADRLKFKVGAATGPITAPRGVQTFGLGAKAEAWLSEHGVTCTPFDAKKNDTPPLVLVGDVTGESGTATWPALRACAERGATVVFLSAIPFCAKEAKDRPLGEELSAHYFLDWLYHKEIALKNHALFEGVQRGGLLDWNTFGAVTSTHVLKCRRMPDDVAAAWFSIGIGGEGYSGGIITGVYKQGKGRIAVNSLRIAENLGDSPAADRLMGNVLRLAAE